MNNEHSEGPTDNITPRKNMAPPTFEMPILRRFVSESASSYSGLSLLEEITLIFQTATRRKQPSRPLRRHIEDDGLVRKQLDWLLPLRINSIRWAFSDFYAL